MHIGKTSSFTFKRLLPALAVLSLFACNSEQRSNTPSASTPPSEQTLAKTGQNTPVTKDNDSATTNAVDQTAGHSRQTFNWEKLRGWHTQGYIARDESIRIEFSREIIEATKVGEDAGAVMVATPELPGKPVFDSASSIAWNPQGKLKPGKKYKIGIKPGGLKNVPADAPPYQFSFQVIPLEFDIRLDSLAPEAQISAYPLAGGESRGDTTFGREESGGAKMWLKGQLLVSDRVKESDAKRLLKAHQQTRRLPIEWNHDRSGKKHQFQIRGIERESFATDLLLQWDGTPVGIETRGQREVAIPANSDFSVLKVAVFQDAGETPYIRVDFSDFLDSTQNLKGLIRLEKHKFRHEIIANTIRIYPAKNLTGKVKVSLSEGIKGRHGQVLKTLKEGTVQFDELRPQVRFVGNGTILPENDQVTIPFEAVAAKAVQVTAFEIYADNMHQFLQVNRLSGDYETRRAGRYLWSKTLPLNPADPGRWNRYSLDVSEMMKSYKAGMLRLTLEILPQHASFACPADSQPAAEARPLQNLEDQGVEEVSGWDGISDAAQQSSYYDYTWSERNNPCNSAYFRFNQDKVRESQNFIASNIGLIAKQDGKGELHVISSDLRSAEPLPGVELSVRNYQGQVMAQAKTDGNGFARIPLSATPFLLTASKFNEFAYLKVNAKTALSVSHFDVGGKTIEKGIKGTIYAERGVWRPGDAMHLTFVVQDKSGQLPKDHPVTMTLTDPRGRLVDSQTHVTPVEGFYTFRLKTAEAASTGRYLATARLGGSTFSKALMVETVRPNRLKIDLSFDGKETLYSSDGAPQGKLYSRWLHGATAANLKADIALKLRAAETAFDRYADYTFDDPARSLDSDNKIILAGRLDDQGFLLFDKPIQPSTSAPGMLKATYTTRVFEQSGAFSISRNSFDFHPYSRYVGLKLPKGDATRNMLLTDRDHTVEIASLNDRGEPVSLDQVEVSLYKIDWKWWWDKSGENLAAYSEGKSTGLLKQSIISTTDGKGEWRFNIQYPEWGRYLIRVCDLQGKHCAGKTVYIDWPGWAGRAQEEGSGAASRLDFFSDKSAYQAGETAIITLPAATQGRALLTVETGSEILEQRWIELGAATANATVGSAGNGSSGQTNSTETATDYKPDEKSKPAGDKQPIAATGPEERAADQRKAEKIRVDIPLTARMTPNVYVHISLLQPHKNKQNDRPIRLYGIIPLLVSDPQTHLRPQLETATEWRPESAQKIKVSEASGRAMTYTLAIVDEGLLGLTGFKTPDLHNIFYSRERLGINTWDLFDEVIGAYGGRLERLLAIGGGDDIETDNEDSKKRRFPPVVKFLGPFKLAENDTAVHEVELPPYLGAVRLMLVAGEQGAYGKTEQEVNVRQPLMLQASLPRKLGPNESFSVPLTLFVMDEAISSVKLEVQTDSLMQKDGLDSSEGATRTIAIEQSGEKLAYVKLKTGNATGKSRLRLIATAGEHRTEVEVNIDVLESNQLTSRTISKVIEPDEIWQTQLEPFGLAGTSRAWLELSSVPALNLERHLAHLMNYPHGCIEQTTSAAFPQLYLGKLMTLDKRAQRDAEHHINTAIDRLSRFQQANGNFSYWPGGDDSNEWASLYAGHFLSEAGKLGFLVPDALLQDWLAYQIDKAQAYLTASEEYSHIQAYRLYVLALAGKPQLGAMNRLRESSRLNDKARWMLASAYHRASQPQAADNLIENLSLDPQPEIRPDRTFSSTLGNLGIRLDNLVSMNRKVDANQLVEKIAEELGGQGFQSTQGIAWALMGVSRYLGDDTAGFSAALKQDGQEQLISSKRSLSSTRLNFTQRYQANDKANSQPAQRVQKGSDLEVRNTSGIKLFASLLNQGIPKAGEELAMQQGLQLAALHEYRQSEQGDEWQTLEPGQPLLRGSDLRLTVTVTNSSQRDAENIALTLPLASGLELLGATEQPKPARKYDHRELRDDRAHYYFSLKAGQNKTFSVVANAAYLGQFYMPAINVEAMYDGKLQARVPGFVLPIVKEFEMAEAVDPGSIENDRQKSISTDAKKGVRDATTHADSLIQIDKVYLHDEANETSRSNMYLIKGDKVLVLESTQSENDKRWHLIRYVTKKGVVLEKWIPSDAISQ